MCYGARPKGDLAARDPDQYFLPTVERNLLMSMECSRPETTDAADDGSDSGSLASAENSAQQGASTGTDRRMLDALAASAAGFDRTFHIDLLT
jgi:hypothetical protein